jgi:hypothetical protein
VLNEFSRVAFRKRIAGDVDSLPADLDRFVDDDNQRRPHQGRCGYGKTPMQTCLDTVPLAQEKLIPSDERVSTPPHEPRGRAERAKDDQETDCRIESWLIHLNPHS